MLTFVNHCDQHYQYQCSSETSYMVQLLEVHFSTNLTKYNFFLAIMIHTKWFDSQFISYSSCNLAIKRFTILSNTFSSNRKMYLHFQYKSSDMSTFFHKYFVHVCFFFFFFPRRFLLIVLKDMWDKFRRLSFGSLPLTVISKLKMIWREDQGLPPPFRTRSQLLWVK